jgi:hypothetical protein
MSQPKWYGFDIRESKTDGAGRRGVVIGSLRFLDSAFDGARRIHNAGSTGLPTDEVLRTDVENLKRAGVPITKDPCGTRWFLAEMPQPDRYLIEASPSKPAAVGSGQYGSGPLKPWGQIGA